MKRRLLLALLGTSLILSSCGGEELPEGSTSSPVAGTDDSNQQSADISLDVSSQEPSIVELTKAEKVTALFAKMAEGASATLVDPSYCTTEFYGDDIGFLQIYTDDYISNGATNGGLVVVKNYGIFQYSYDTTTESIDAAQVYSPNPALTIGDVYFTTKDLGLAAKEVTFTESPRTHTFSTTDDDFCSIAASIIGYGTTVDKYSTKKVSFMVSDDGESLNNLTLELSGASASETYKDVKESGLKIENVGSTIDLDVEVFSKNHKPTAATAWGTSETSAFASIYTGFSIPFPTGATWAVTEQLTSSKHFVYNDLKCGDKVTAYAAQLAANGFTYDNDNDIYTKNLAAATSSTGAINEAVRVRFVSAAETSYPDLFPNGLFAIEAFAYEVENFTSQADLNAFLGTKMSNASSTKSIYPALNFGTNCTGLVLKDSTSEVQAKYPDDIQLFYGTIKAYYATEAEANAAVSSLITQFVNAGYTDYTSSYGEYYGCDGILQKSDGSSYDSSTYTSYAYSSTIYIVIGRDENENYLGYITVYMDHCGEEDYGYDDYY